MARAYFQVAGDVYPMDVVYRGKHTFTLKDWEDLTTAWVVLLGKEYRVYREDKTIVDLGANIGVFAVFAKHCSPEAKIVAVEPFPENLQRLDSTLAENNLSDTIATRGIAVSGADGEVRFDASPDIPSHSRKISENGASPSQTTQVTVPALSLKTFLDTEELEQVDFLKMDIEGAEYDAILNTDPETLKRIKRMGIEYHQHGHQSITDHLKKAGFAITYHPKSGPYGVIEYTQV
ncbi:FkbM family methyltransferase [Rubripirellula amarantea]|nr:FkbM family methyltransferase [Rubripirellula amarantea]